MTPDLSRIGLVSVCFHSMAVLPDMLNSVPSGVPIVLVDNAGQAQADTELEELAKRNGAKLIVNPKNCGFGVACNQGAAALKTEFILFLNPDASLDEHTLPELLKAADKYPDASAFNPRLTDRNGGQLFKRNSHLFPRSEKMPRGWPAQDQEVTVLSGAALLVRRSAFTQVGGFDPNIFLYHEDDDLALRLRHQVGKLMFVRDAIVTHMEGRSSARSAKIAALKAWHMGRSRVYATRKHGRPMPFLSSLFVATVQLLSPAVAASRRKRAKQVAFWRGVVSTLRDGGAHSV